MMIDTSEWQEFKIGDLFNLHKGTRLTKANMIEGGIRFVSAANTNNGITASVGNNDHVHSEGTLTVCYNGNGGTGKSFYQPEQFWASDDVHVLYPKFNLPEICHDVAWTGLNVSVGLFLATVIECAGRQKYGFTDKWKLEYMREDKIKLPVNENGEPDWVYMDNFMSEMTKHVSCNFQAIHNITEAKHLIDQSSWKDFKIGDLFAVSRPIARSQKQYDDGQVPFVASSATNNGITKWCTPRDDEALDSGGCITVSPLDGSAFYQPDDFLGRGGAGSAIIILRKEGLSERQGLFVASAIRASFDNCSYVNQLNLASVATSFIKLPAVSDSYPDWNYMDTYMGKLMAESDAKLKALNGVPRV